MALCGDRACRTPKRVAKSNLVGPGAAFSHEMRAARHKWCSTAISKKFKNNSFARNEGQTVKTPANCDFLAPSPNAKKLVKLRFWTARCNRFARNCLRFSNCRRNPSRKMLVQRPKLTTHCDFESQTQPFAQNDGWTSKTSVKLTGVKAARRKGFSV